MTNLGLKLKHPDLDEGIYEAYSRVVSERVLPSGMSFSRCQSWNTPHGKLEVDWMKLQLQGRPATPEESETIMANLPAKLVNGMATDKRRPMRVGGFSCRFRDRFVSSGSYHLAMKSEKELLEEIDSKVRKRRNWVD